MRQKEIWDALKAAATAFESEDYGLAQAIVDGANITLPYGGLTDCYDELGTRYQLPVYCLSLPVNVVAAWEKSASLPSGKFLDIEEQEDLGEVRQRWFYGGILLPDRFRINEFNIPHNHVIQSIITDNVW
ncbi:hypothetical protein HAZT_HAZT000476 [Hyalella azteca]|uniref:DC-UbP/UBTD2 N-terminal domain-containing protein n=1 Tax=Hyalella azteca TaxID=294128 RepID=A0A6A0H8V6_HYAAZ|nr:hypothetical protein HAZT_HAZT000476 [Hyalella azteca]